MPPMSEPAHPADNVAPAPVTVIVPARNEVPVLDYCLQGVRSQDHEPLRMIVVDDASTDATAELAQRHAHDDPRITVTSSGGPPPGWNGKTHAMHVGVQARGAGEPGEWLLFLDADTEPAPQLVTRLLATATELDADLVSTPGGPPPGASLVWWLLMPPGTQLICENAAPDGRSRKAFAIGHCILVRRAYFDKVGGWTPLAAVGNEDVALATAVRDAGGRTRTVRSVDTLTSHGMDPFGRGWVSFRKSFSVGTQGSVPLLTGAGVAHLAFGLTPPVALIAGSRSRQPWLVVAGLVAWGAQGLAHTRAAQAMGAPARSGPAAPVSWVLVGGLFLDAAHRVRRGAMQWKGRPLGTVGRGGGVRRQHRG
ncbi:MAG: glycosyltransferase [Pseudonocardiaceae bacterium]|nr:glycosyltransferase [Pseudonocardiaceae bacterium]